MKTAYQRHAYNVAQLKQLAKMIERIIADKTSFALILFDQEFIGEEIVRLKDAPPIKSTAGYSTYIGNADRAFMIAALRECADNLERKMDVPGVAPKESGTIQ